MKAIFQQVLGVTLPGDQPPVRAEPVPEEAPEGPIDEAAEPIQPTQES